VKQKRDKLENENPKELGKTTTSGQGIVIGVPALASQEILE
jgi:hypothetical protein